MHNLTNNKREAVTPDGATVPMVSDMPIPLVVWDVGLSRLVERRIGTPTLGKWCIGGGVATGILLGAGAAFERTRSISDIFAVIT